MADILCALSASRVSMWLSLPPAVAWCRLVSRRRPYSRRQAIAPIAVRVSRPLMISAPSAAIVLGVARGALPMLRRLIADRLSASRWFRLKRPLVLPVNRLRPLDLSGRLSRPRKRCRSALWAAFGVRLRLWLWVLPSMCLPVCCCNSPAGC